MKNKTLLLAGTALGALLLAQAGFAQEFINPGATSGTPGSEASNVLRNPVAGGLDDAAVALRQGETQRAIQIYQQLLNTSDEGQRAQARYGMAVALSQLGQPQQALNVLESTPANDSPLGQALGTLRGELVLQLADAAWWQSGPDGGTQGVARWLAQYDRLTIQPNLDKAARLRAYLQSADNQVSQLEGPMTVGVLLPLSGQLAPVGEEILQGLQLGISSRVSQGGSDIVLKPFDTATDARKAARDALDAGAKIIIGPLRSSEVRAVAAMAKPANVPVLNFSSDDEVAGPNAWSLAYTPAGQARAAARWAVENGFSHVAGLVPSNAYGQLAWSAFQDEVSRLGGRVAGVSFFNPKNVDISASVRSLPGAGVKNGAAQFEALFIPAPAASLPLISAQLAFLGLDRTTGGSKVQLLGTALWQSGALLTSKGDSVRGGVFGAPAKTPDFDADYAATFGTQPGLMASVGADSGRIVAEVAYLQKRLRTPVSELLLRGDGFPGYGGYIALGPDGQSRRSQSVVQVSETAFSVIAPAQTQLPLPLPQDLRPATHGRGIRWW